MTYITAKAHVLKMFCARLLAAQTRLPPSSYATCNSSAQEKGFLRVSVAQLGFYGTACFAGCLSPELTVKVQQLHCHCQIEE